MASPDNHQIQDLLPVGTPLNGGKYVVTRYLASGSFGNTYIARDTALEVLVVVKEFYIRDICERAGQTRVRVMKEEKADFFDRQRKKFRKEARRIYNLSHPNIVRVHNLFDENDTSYYVMDFVDGESLEDCMKRVGALPETEVWRLLKQVLSALQCVHNEGIWHLDLKPANILVNKEGKALLIDFGASKQRDNDNVDQQGLPTAVAYTQGFAPIEQSLGDYNNIGPWTDFYALGATLYRLLTLKTPPLATEIARDAEKALPFPATVSQKMRQFIFWMMRFNHVERPQDIAQIVRALNKEIPQQPKKVKSETKLQKPVKSIKKDLGTVVLTETSSVSNPILKEKRTKVWPIVAILVVVVIGAICFFCFRPSDTQSTDDISVVEQSDYASDSAKSKEIERLKEALKQKKEYVTGQTYQDADGKDFTYTGEVALDKPSGKGTGIYPYGTYSGEYSDGLRHGRGKFQSKDGSNHYEGTFANDNYDSGKLTLSNGEYFEGTFQNGQPYNGKWYKKEGTFDGDVINGKE